MQTIAIQRPKSGSRATLLTGRIISAIIILFLLVDSIMKIIMESHYVDGTRQAGFSTNMVQPWVLIVVHHVPLYCSPYSNCRCVIKPTWWCCRHYDAKGKSFWFPVAFCSLAWIGLYFQNARLRLFFRTGNKSNKKLCVIFTGSVFHFLRKPEGEGDKSQQYNNQHGP